MGLRLMAILEQKKVRVAVPAGSYIDAARWLHQIQLRVGHWPFVFFRCGGLHPSFGRKLRRFQCSGLFPAVQKVFPGFCGGLKFDARLAIPDYQ